MQVRVFLDSGSELSVVTKAVSDQLYAKEEESKRFFAGVGSRGESSSIVYLDVLLGEKF
jgi:hypothetical protein